MIWLACGCAALGLGILVGEWLWRRRHPRLPPERDTEPW